MIMRLEQRPAVEPHWPYGTVAYFYISNFNGEKNIGTHELAVKDVEEIEGGYRVTACLLLGDFDPQNREFVFEVDENGESAQCVPWDDDLEAQLHPHRIKAVFTEAEGTKPIRLGDPPWLSDDEIWAAMKDEGVAQNER